VPYIVIKTNGQEIDRRELTGNVVIGRAPDCDVIVRDIMLSRRHCRLEQEGGGWRLCDLQSKNGTMLNGERLVGPRMIQDNDVLRLGRWKVIFHAGMPEEDFAERLLSPARPADPGDSLAGTLSGFTLLLPGEGEILQNMPCPQPRPKDPPAYNQEELQTLLSGIASSSWDSVYAEARQPMRSVSEAVCEDEEGVRRRVRPRSPMDLSLQVNPPPPAVVEPQTPAVVVTIPLKSRRKPAFRPSLHAAVAAMWIVALVLLNIDHKPMPKEAMGDQTTPIFDPIPKIVPMNDSITALAAPADYGKTADDEQDEISTGPASQRKPVKEMHIDRPMVKMAAETGAVYFPLMAW
jgi:hypothetical protein